ncbi:MAG: ABC transporter permease [Phycisphaerales bacterium]
MIASRLAQLPLILAAVYTLTLALAWAVPGNPLDRPEGRRPDPEVVKAMLARYNMDSFGGFYWSYLADASGVSYARARLTGTPTSGPVFDFGPSLQYPDRSVNEMIAASLPVSATIGVLAVLVGLGVGLGAGLLGAARPKTWVDTGSLALAMVGISLPAFVVGAGLQMVFSLWLGWFSVASWGHPRDLVLPAVTLGLPYAAYIARLTRVGLMEQLTSDYARTALAKGLSRREVLLRHALPNAILPVVSYLGPASAAAMTGSFVVERVFSIPGGMGQHFVNAVQNKDLFLIIGVVLVYSTLLVVLNLAVDVLYRWIDPRIRTD